MSSGKVKWTVIIPVIIVADNMLKYVLKERRLRWYGYVEHSNGAVKTAFHIQVEGKRGPGRPRWHGSNWQRGIAESGSSRLSTLWIEICGDLVWDLPCVQQASYLEGGPEGGLLMWMLLLYLQVNKKSDYDDIWCFFCFSEKIRIFMLCEWASEQMINMKWQAFSLWKIKYFRSNCPSGNVTD